MREGSVVKFGVFDHLDDAGVPLGALYADRLQFAEALDRGGFHAYHLAEHHGTPLGMAASPGIFLVRAGATNQERCASARWFICCRSIIRCA